MAASNANAAVLKVDGTDISGFWTEEIGNTETAAMVAMNRGSNATHEQRGAGLSDNTFTFLIFYGTTEAERVLSFNLLKPGQEVVLYHAPLGAIAGQQYFEGPMIIESREGPKPKQDKSGQLVATIKFNGNGPPTHELEDGVIT